MTTQFANTNELTVTGLAAYKGERFLFRELNFTLNASQLLHLTGSNGVGKTTLLRILVGLGFIEEGEVVWNQKFIQKQKTEYHQCLHYIGHKLGLKLGLTCYENLYYFAKLEQYALDKTLIESVLKQVGLTEKLNVQAHYLSAGQKQRLALARLLLIPRALWILDEPFTALDTEAQTMLNQLLDSHLQQQGMVIITTHQDSLTLRHGFDVLNLKAA